MGNEQTGIVRASFLNILCIFPETGEMEMFIACATLAPRICAIIGDVGWDIATVDSHCLPFASNEHQTTSKTLMVVLD